jgi:hypothetical protein
MNQNQTQPYEWRGLRQTRGLRSKAKRVLSQFSPHDFTAFKWEGTASFLHYITVVLLLGTFLTAELNPFYLKVGSALDVAGAGSMLIFILSATESSMDGTRPSHRRLAANGRLLLRTACR